MQYIAAGFDPAAFWQLTPRLFMVHMEGAALRLEREAKDAAWMAWHIAALTRVKKMPRLNQFIPGKKTASKPVGWQAQLAAWQAYSERKKGRRGAEL